jgi:hypothetical protein
MMPTGGSLRGRLAAIVLCLCPSAALAQYMFFERMQIEQIVAGVGGNTEAQAIQLRMRMDDERWVAGARIYAYDADGKNPILLVDLGKNVPNGQVGDRVLVATSAMKWLTNPPLAPDAIMQPIPPEYISAGRITWECDCGSKYWSLSSGGYLGSNFAAMLNDEDGDFGPPYPGPFPTEGAQGLLFQGEAADLSVANSLDYLLTPGAAVLTNNARNSFTVTIPPAAPSDLEAVEFPKGVARLTWADNSTDETGFRVQRQQSIGGQWVNAQIVGTTVADTTLFMDSPGPGVWRYQVEAVNGAVRSGFAPFERVTPAMPTGLTAQHISGAVIVRWTDASDLETTYEIQRSKKEGTWGASQTVAKLGPNWTVWVNAGVKGQYRYRVRSGSGGVFSAWTTWKVVTVP